MDSKGNSDIALITLGKEVNFTNALDLKSKIDELLLKGYTQFVVDFRELKYLDSSGFGLIIYLKNQVKECQGSISFVNVSNTVMRLFNIMKLAELFNPRTQLTKEQEKTLSQPAKSPVFSSTLKVPADPSCMTHIRNEIKAQLQEYLEAERVFDTVLAFGEALGNAFDHGVRNSKFANIFVTVTAYDDRTVIEVSDNGLGLDMHKSHLPEPTQTRGRGIRLMYMLVDSVEITKKAYGEGTIVKLVTLR